MNDSNENNQIDFSLIENFNFNPNLNLNLNQISNSNPPKLSLHLDDFSLSSSLSKSNQNSNQDENNDQTNREEEENNNNKHQFIRQTSKRWTSFTEIGKSVLKLNSLDRSTIHSSYQISKNQFHPTKSLSTHSLSHHHHHHHHHRNLFKLFHQEPQSIPSHPIDSSCHFTLPSLPPMSESLDASFDEAIKSITHSQNQTNVSSSISKSISEPIPSSHFIPTSAPLEINPLDKSTIKVPNSIDECINEDKKVTTSKQLPTNELTVQPEVEVEAEETAIEKERGEEVLNDDNDNLDSESVMKEGPSVETSNSSNELNATEEIAHSTINTEDRFKEDNTLDEQVLAKKKKNNSSAHFIKLLFFKGLTHLKPPSFHNDSSKTLNRTITHNHNQ